MAENPVLPDTMENITSCPRWEVNGTAAEGYITVHISALGKVNVRQGEYLCIFMTGQPTVLADLV